MSLAAHFVVRRPAHTTRVDIDADPGEVIGLVGPNGAGKSTTLRAIAGLQPITSGTITINGRPVAGDGVHVPAYRRQVGFVFQDHLLFPHMTAIENVAFGPRSRGVRKPVATTTARDWLDRMDIGDLADRKPAQMSGGQAQRVAVARALAGEPGILLLDEPTAALDASVAMMLRTRLRDHLATFAGVSIVVTHTALDAMVLADRLVVLDNGNIVQTGSPADIAARPRTQHVAALVGLNLLHGEARDGVLSSPGGAALVAAEQVNGPAFASFRPAAVSLFTEPPTGSPRNVWPGTVRSLVPHGDAVRVQLEGELPLLADITPGAMTALQLRPGDRVWASVKATEVAIYAA